MTSSVPFRDRADAGRALAAAFADYPRTRPVVLGLPRGGVPVAAPLARALGADLDVLVVHKLGVPGDREFAMGAVGEGGVRVVDDALRGRLGVDDEQLAAVVAHEQAEVDRRLNRYRAGRDRLDLVGRNVIVVDDGVATGSTAAPAIEVARRMGAAHVTFATPVAALAALARLRRAADDVVALATPDPFYAVGTHYEAFPQVSDEEVIDALAGEPRDVVVESDGQLLPGTLTTPRFARGVVVFAHGSGSSRLSPRNVAVAATLARAGLATLLFDLLSSAEEHDRAAAFDIVLLARRLHDATQWVRTRSALTGSSIGYFGASTGAAAALVADAQRPGVVSAIVSRGGRPDLAGDWLPAVTAPTLLIVGGQDAAVLDLNRQARTRLRCPSDLAVVPGATHLFAEPGTLAQAADLATSWFLRHLR